MASCPEEPAHTRRRYAVRIADTASISCTPPVFQSLHAVFVIRVSRSPTYEVLISFATKYRQPQPCLPAFMRAVYVSCEFCPSISVGRRTTLSRVKKAAATKISLSLTCGSCSLCGLISMNLSGRFYQCAELVDFLAGLFAGLPEEFAGKAIYNGQYRAQPAEHGKG